MASPAQPKPLCLCGCGHPVRRRANRYASVGCVPRVSRSEGGRLGRQKGSFLHRMRKYRAQIEAVKRTGGKLTTEDLLALFAEVDRTAYCAGWHCAHHAGRQIPARQTA